MDEIENGLQQLQAFLRGSRNIPRSEEAMLIGGYIISEWLLPDGTRYLARSPVGNIAEWTTQGYLFSTLFDGQGSGWGHLGPDDDEEEEEEFLE